MKRIDAIPKLLAIGAALLAMTEVQAQAINRNANISLRINPFAYSVTVLPLESAAGMSNGIIIGRANGVGVTYVNGQVTPLPGKTGYSDIWPTSISANGYIVGFAKSANNTRGLFWPSMTNSPYDMGALGAITMPAAVNSQGVAVGSYYQTSTSDLPSAFRWSMSSGMRSIAPSGTNQSQALDISESGYVAGYAWFGGDQAVIRWLPGTYESRVVAYSDIGQRALDNGSVYGYTTLWDLNNHPTSIAPSPVSWVSQISTAGRKVGSNYFDSPGARAWTVAPNSATIQFLPVPSGTLRSYAFKVNACGSILGQIQYSDGTARAVLWTKMLCDQLAVALP